MLFYRKSDSHGMKVETFTRFFYIFKLLRPQAFSFNVINTKILYINLLQVLQNMHSPINIYLGGLKVSSIYAKRY